MFEDYKRAVLEFYLERKSKFQLSLNLENPGRDKIRKECVAVFLKKNSKQDKDFVQSFFNPANQYSDQVRSIEKFSLDKFRPLVSFLKSGTSVRDDDHIKLLAWLIDFPSYEDWRTQGVFVGTIERSEAPNDVKEIDSEDVLTQTQKDDPTVAPVANVDIQTEAAPTVETVTVTETGGGSLTDRGRAPTIKTRMTIISKLIILGLALVLAMGISYWSLNGNINNMDILNPIMSAGPKKCMHWVGDHYETIACKQTSSTPIIALNQGVLSRLKKINSPDTLTKYSLGRVWYAKIDGKPEFYTDSGMHPVDTVKRLKPITTYILTTYVSYYRYLLRLVLWSAAVFVLLVFVGALLYRYVPKPRLARS